MKKAEEYRQHAKECRDLAKGLEAGEQREQLLTLAATWERLADERMTQKRDQDSPRDRDADDRAR
jgi:hypothetical protein